MRVGAKIDVLRGVGAANDEGSGIPTAIIIQYCHRPLYEECRTGNRYRRFSGPNALLEAGQHDSATEAPAANRRAGAGHPAGGAAAINGVNVFALPELAVATSPSRA
jgi:hypothetical protein